MAADKERGPGSASAEIGKYLEILAKDPNSRVFAPLAEAYRKAGMLDDAIETALEGLKVHPNYFGGRVALGRAYFEKKQYAEAAAEMKKVVAAAPDNLMAHKILGQIAYAQNDLPAAEKSFKMVLLLDPRDQEAQQFVANIGGARPAPAQPAAAAVPQAPPAATASPPPQPPPPKPAAGIVMPPPPMEEIPIPGLSPPGPQAEVPAPFDEIQPLEDFDLAGGDLLDDVAAPVPPGRPSAVAPAATMPPPIDTGLDLSEPEPWIEESPAARPAPEPIAARAQPAALAPDEGMQVEVFTRVPWGMEQSPAGTPLHPAPPQEPTAAPAGPAAAGDSPFEVFGRPKRRGPPPSSKGESPAFREIEIEHTAHEPVPEAPTPGEEPVFEVFTRTPEPRTPPPPAKAGRGELAGPREIEIETTAFAPYENFEPEQPPAPEAGFEIERTAHAVVGSEARETAPELVLEDELPRIDLADEMVEERPEEPLEPMARFEEPGSEAEPMLEVEPPAEPPVEPSVDWSPGADLAPELAPEPLLEPVTEPVPEHAREPQPEMEPEPETWYPRPDETPQAEAAAIATGPWDDGLAEMSLDDEIPNIDLTREVQEGPLDGEGIEPERVEDAPFEPAQIEAERIDLDRVEEDQFEEEPEPAPPEAAPGAARGVFDTETLASIYVSQGFYGRAADIYRRLIEQRPGDEGLRAKLEDALAREQGESAPPAAAVPAAAPEAAPAAVPEDRKIRQLQTLLEAFRGGRPR